MANILTYGNAPEWGISASEDEALLMESITFSGSTQKYEQKGLTGNIIGAVYYDQQASFNISANVAAGKTPSYAMAGIMTLANFGETSLFNASIAGGASAATALVDTVEYGMTADSARTATITGVVYNFTHTVTTGEED